MRGDAKRLEARLETLHEQQAATTATLAALGDELRELREELAMTRHLVMTAAAVAVDDEAQVRRRLRAARAEPEYREAWSDPAPLVSILVPTYDRWTTLEERAIPSALAQDHAAIEVVVVGDAAPPETARAIARIGDPRVRYENLLIRGTYPDDPRQRWLVAGTAPLNRAIELARGSWFVILNDDDALRPDHVSALLAHARETGAEVAYGRFLQRSPDGGEEEIGAFPPALGAFAWQAAIQHRALRMFEWELAAETFALPGDWHRARRMLRAGVSFAHLDRVLCDYFPSQLWEPR